MVLAIYVRNVNDNLVYISFQGKEKPSEKYLDPVVYLSILPCTVVGYAFRPVPLHYVASRQLHAHLDFRLSPILLA
jgi:hypothetical protein